MCCQLYISLMWWLWLPNSYCLFVFEYIRETKVWNRQNLPLSGKISFCLFQAFISNHRFVQLFMILLTFPCHLDDELLETFWNLTIAQFQYRKFWNWYSRQILSPHNAMFCCFFLIFEDTIPTFASIEVLVQWYSKKKGFFSFSNDISIGGEWQKGRKRKDYFHNILVSSGLFSVTIDNIQHLDKDKRKCFS